MDEEMTLAFSFPDQSPSFVNGYEAGKLGARMEAAEQTIDCGCEEGFPLREENLELVNRMAAFYRYTVELKAVQDGWASVLLTKGSRPALRAVT